MIAEGRVNEDWDLVSKGNDDFLRNVDCGCAAKIPNVDGIESDAVFFPAAKDLTVRIEQIRAVDILECGMRRENGGRKNSCLQSHG